MEVVCIQANGERLPVERWVYDGVMNGTVRDPVLIRIVRGAVAWNFGMCYETCSDRVVENLRGVGCS